MRNLLLVLLTATVLIFPAIGFTQPTVTQLINNGPTNERLNIVIFGDGYTSAEESQFNSDAVNLLNYSLTIGPFSAYTSYFNAFSIFVASNESGSDHPSLSILKDTYFNSTYESSGIERALTIPPNSFNGNYSQGVGKVMALLSAHVPDYDIIVLIVNDPQYGGTGGTVAITSVHSAAPEIVVHELGHSFGYLADEYDYPGGSTGEAPNATSQTVRELIKWNQWILPTTPIPTPEISSWGSVVGLFEGAAYQASGWYRPKLDCKMQTLGPEFCEVCTEQLIKSIYGRLSPIENFAPSNLILDMNLADSVVLSITPLVPVAHTLNIQWLINDVPVIGETSDTFLLHGSDLSIGTLNTITAMVSDPTAMVRNDPGQIMTDQVSWSADMSFADTDDDGIFDFADNCVYIFNPTQSDRDLDGVGDACCCIGNRGDANDDGADANILDLTFLVDYIFRSGQFPNCPNEADFNSDASFPNILDLTFAVDRIFRGGPAPGPCIQFLRP